VVVLSLVAGLGGLLYVRGTRSEAGYRTPAACSPGRCKTYTRVRNVVFSLDLEGFPVAGAREPASSVRALAALAVRQLRGSS